MTHTYEIEGMTCNGCRTGVEKILSDLDGVDKAQVNLEKKEATVTMGKHISINKIRKALPEKYTIREKTTSNGTVTDKPKMASTYVEPEEPSDLARLKPLFLILFYITTAAILLNRNPWSTGEFMLDFMGMFYIVFGFFKLLDLRGFMETFQMYDPLAKVVPVYGWVYPFIETALGLMFLLRFGIPIALVATIIILGITTIGVTQTLLSKQKIKCACLGTALNLPMTKATFIENAIMLVMAGWMLTQFM